MRSKFSLLFALCLLLWGAAAAKGGELTGREIMEKADHASGLGIRNGVARVRMVLEDRGGKKRERIFVVKSKEAGSARKMIIKFLSPADVMGTGLLMLEERKGQEDQYLYLPETGKVRKIAGKQSHASFLSSDFLYWDLRRHDPGEALHERLPDGEVSGVKCRVVRTTPAEESGAPYGLIVSWVAVSNDVPLAMEFYDRKGARIKKLLVRRIEKNEGRWVVMESRMTDLRSGHCTTLVVLSLESMKDLPDDEFTKTALLRVE